MENEQLIDYIPYDMQFCHPRNPRKMPVAVPGNGATRGLRRAGFRRRLAMAAAVVGVAFGLAAGWPLPVPAQGQTAKPSISAQSGPIKLDPKYGVGAWIWAAETHDQQLCRLWRGFEIPAGAKVNKARLCVTADDSYSLFLDGRELGRGGDWKDLTEYDLTLLLEPGWHTLAIEGFNTVRDAGVLAGLRIELANGRTIEIASDESWKVVPNTESRWIKRTRPRPNWPSATIVKAFGLPPWGPRFVAVVRGPRLDPITSQFWQTGWFEIALLALSAAVALVCVRLIGELALHSRMEQVVQRERARMARDIHDNLTAGLTQLVLIGEVVQRALPEDSEPRQQARKVCEKARGLVHSMHDVIWAVDSKHDTTRDFASYVCKYAETFLQPTPIRCRFDLEEEMPDFPFDLGSRRNLFLAVKEAIHNAVRHSGASELVMRIHRLGHGIVVIIEDNGKGFDPALTDKERNGLSNMMKRAADAGGTCSIVSQPGAGCRVVLTVPLVHPAKGPFDWLARLWHRASSYKSQPAASSPAANVSKTPV